MAKIKKTKVDGALVYPATIFPAVKDPNTGQTLTEKLSELGSEVLSEKYIVEHTFDRKTEEGKYLAFPIKAGYKYKIYNKATVVINIYSKNEIGGEPVETLSSQILNGSYVIVSPLQNAKYFYCNWDADVVIQCLDNDINRIEGAIKEEINNVKTDIGTPKKIISEASGSTEYRFIAGHRYLVTNHINLAVTLTTRLTDSSTDYIDIATLPALASTTIVATSDAYFLRYGDKVNLTIVDSDATYYKANEAYTKANDNYKEIDNLVERVLVSAAPGFTSYNFVKGHTYFIENFGNTTAVLSFSSEKGEVIDVIGTSYPHTLLKVVAQLDYEFIKYGDGCSLKIYPKEVTYSKETEYHDFNVGAIATGLAYNEVVDIVIDSTQANCKTIVIPCRQFDEFIITAAGSGANHTYCFTGLSYEYIYSSVNAVSNLKVYAPSDGYLIINSFADIAVTHSSVYNIKDVEKSLTKAEFSSDTSAAFPYHFVKGKKYLLTNNSKTGNLQRTFTLRQEPDGVYYNRVSPQGWGSKTIIIPEIDANYIKVGDPAEFTIEEYDSYSRRVDDLDSSVCNHGKELPSVVFTYEKNFIDCESDLIGMDFSRSDIMEQLYAKYDSLLADNSEYITKVDAAEECGMTYPSYCNLNGIAANDYLATPSYRLYMYKLVDNRSRANTILKKKKIFIFAGVHGNEIAAPFDLFLFVKNLCLSTNEDYFKLRSAFDFYILPCVNGYGMYHGTRGNANKVNVNRNFPILNWTILGDGTQDSAGANDYSGPYAASEFETKLIIKLIEDNQYNLVVDHHNYGHLHWQFYVTSSYRRLLPLVYESLIDCSFAFIKNKPNYFGNRYKIFFNEVNASVPDAMELANNQGTSRWAFEKGIELACTLETSACINYTDGVYNATGKDQYGKDLFEVNEFTLRNQICRYGSLLIGTDL